MGYNSLNAEISDKDSSDSVGWIIDVMNPSGIDHGFPDDFHSFSITRIFPNPYRSQTIINYTIPENGIVTLEIYSVMGQKIRTLVDQYQTSGMYSATWDGKNDQNYLVNNGMYICRLKFIAGGNKYIQERRIVRIK